MAAPLCEMLKKLSEFYGDNIALEVIDDGKVKQITFSRLYKDVFIEREILKKNSAKRIGLVGYNSYAWIVTAIASLISGKTLILLDANLPEDNLCDLITYSDVDGLLVEHELEELSELLLSKLSNINILEFWNDEFRNIATTVSEELIDEEDFLCFTSGTSKSAKGVVITTEALSVCVYSAKGVIPGKAGERYYIPLPLHHIYGFTEVFHVWYRGGIVNLGNGARYLERDMMTFDPQIMMIVPSMLRYLLDKDVFCPSLHSILTGGSYCAPELEIRTKEKGLKHYNLYGLSETLGMICSSTLEKGICWLKPFDNLKFFTNENGEAGVELPFHMTEYYKKPQDTKEALNGNVFMTGDAGILDDDGFLKIKGRIRDTIVLENGEKLHAEDTDTELSGLSGVKEGAVIYSDSALIAVLVPDEDTDKNQIKKVLDRYNSKKPPAQRIEKLYYYNSPLPRTVTGKLQRFKLEKQYQSEKI